MASIAQNAGIFPTFLKGDIQNYDLGKPVNSSLGSKNARPKNDVDFEEGESNASIFRLKGSIQNYDWGKPSSSSLVARLARNSVGEDIDEGKEYAELWMGTHKNGPSTLWNDPNTSLHGLVISSPRHFLGPRLTTSTFTEDTKFPNSTHVPFLFKILSIAKALPLQAHPDKALGEQLHKEDSQQFVDANHKPEIAVAISDGFRGFVGFREPHAIAKDLETIPEIREIIANDELIARLEGEQSKDVLKAVFTRLLTADQSDVSKVVAKLVSRIDRQGAQVVGGSEEVAAVVKQLNEQYPGDVGVLAAPFFMNLVTLNKGESVYIGADEAHAYLEGDIIECMAVSDNVLNAAFVPPESRNTDTFLHSLTYTARPASHWSLACTPYKKSTTGKTSAFDPPFEEFTVLWTQLGGPGERGADANPDSGYTYGGGRDAAVGRTPGEWEKEGREVLKPAEGPTIGIVTSGEVQFVVQTGEFEELTLGEGGIVFVKPNTEVAAQTVEGEGEVWWATYSE